MNSVSLIATVRDGSVVDLVGNLDVGAGDALMDAYAEAAADADGVILNFERVEYINSSGLAALVHLLAQARQDSKRVLAYGITEHFTEIFAITRVADMIEIHPDRESAVAAATAG